LEWVREHALVFPEWDRELDPTPYHVELQGRRGSRPGFLVEELAAFSELNRTAVAHPLEDYRSGLPVHRLCELVR
jgi:hypothetical protein